MFLYWKGMHQSAKQVWFKLREFIMIWRVWESVTKVEQVWQSLFKITKVWWNWGSLLKAEKMWLGKKNCKMLSVPIVEKT